MKNIFINCKFLNLFNFIMISSLCSACVTFAPPSPMVTFGGPKTTGKGTSETVLAAGTGAALFSGAHSGGLGWFGRYKYGLSDKWDIGVDAISFSHSDKYCFTAKFAPRYQLSSNFRLEGGIGGADDSYGKSLNCDIGITWGTINQKTWNYYSTLRIGYAHGYPGNILFEGNSNEGDTTAPANTYIALLNIGTQGKIIEKMDFIFEGGYGYIFPKGNGTGIAVYISCGILFKIGEE